MYQGGPQQMQQMQWSEWVGGQGGYPTDFSGNPNLCLVAVRGRCAQLVDNLQFLFLNINTGQYVESPVCGKNGGSEFIYQAPAGQWIDQVITYNNEYLQAVEFVTNAGDRSPKFGKKASNRKDHNMKGRRITGVRIRSG